MKTGLILQVGLLVLVSINLFWLTPVYSQCTITITCTSPGPPTWEYTYSGTGISGDMYAFLIYDAECVDGSTAPAPFTTTTYTDGASFYSSTNFPCGSTIPGFTITAAGTGVTNGTVSWHDPVNKGWGTCNGPVCGWTPTPTMTPTPTPTFTLSPGPWPTPTWPVGELQLISAGPPAWTYRWFGNTLGFTLNCSCCTGLDKPDPDWQWMKLPSGRLQASNYLSPIYTHRWYEPFVVIQEPDPGAVNAMISYEFEFISNPIEGPECAPTATVTPTVTISHDVPVSRNTRSVVLFVLSALIMFCLVFQAVRTRA